MYKDYKNIFHFNMFYELFRKQVKIIEKRENYFTFLYKREIYLFKIINLSDGTDNVGLYNKIGKKYYIMGCSSYKDIMTEFLIKRWLYIIDKDTKDFKR